MHGSVLATGWVRGCKLTIEQSLLSLTGLDRDSVEMER